MCPLVVSGGKAPSLQGGRGESLLFYIHDVVPNAAASAVSTDAMRLMIHRHVSRFVSLLIVYVK